MIPCLDDPEAEGWQYTFPKVVDPEGTDITFDIKCPGLPFDLFDFEISDGTMTMLLNISPSLLPFHGGHRCEFNAYDIEGKSLSTMVALEVNCDKYVAELDKNSGDNSKNSQADEETPPPVPTITSISSTGLVTLIWNKNMKLFSTDTKRNLAAQQMKVWIKPGSEMTLP